MPERPFAIAFRIVILAALGVLLALDAHRGDQPRELVRGGDHRSRLSPTACAPWTARFPIFRAKDRTHTLRAAGHTLSAHP